MLKRNLTAIAILGMALFLTSDAFGQKTKVTKNQKPSRQQTFVPSQAANSGTYGWQRDWLTEFPLATRTNTNLNTPAAQLTHDPEFERLPFNGRKQTRSAVSPNQTIPTPKKSKRFQGDIGDGTGI